MSKAFTREDDQPDLPVVSRRVSSLPPGTQNLMTPDGERRLREELAGLKIARDQLLATRGNPDKPQQLVALEQRAMLVDEMLRSASVVPPPASADGRVRFGATVSVREQDGSVTRHRIVGVDEVDFDRGWVSWRSPIGKALLNATVGQRVRLKVPSGEKDLTIVAVAYE